MSAAVEQRVVATCGQARATELRFPQRGDGTRTVPTPVFMPVGTQGTVKGLPPAALAGVGCGLLLGNTYHLGHRPGADAVAAMGGLHAAMRWGQGRAILTDSGGFQMVSLARLARVTEAGVAFTSPHDGSETLLTPERSMALQRALGSDIAMALDDVVRPTTRTPGRVAEAAERTVRWLDRCEAVIPRGDPRQALFGIVQGGLDAGLRDACGQAIVRRGLQGYAVGGLSGGEEKGAFWRAVACSAALLPRDRPRYAMGVGYPEDMLVCVALGIDMFDCVWPTRTARFGTALVRDAACPSGSIDLRARRFECDLHTLDDAHCCACDACQGGFTRGALHAMFASPATEALAGQLVSQHNVSHQLRLLGAARNAIVAGEFGRFVSEYMVRRYCSAAQVPSWIVDALAHAGITFPASLEQQVASPNEQQNTF